MQLFNSLFKVAVWVAKLVQDLYLLISFGNVSWYLKEEFALSIFRVEQPTLKAEGDGSSKLFSI